MHCSGEADFDVCNDDGDDDDIDHTLDDDDDDDDDDVKVGVLQW